MNDTEKEYQELLKTDKTNKGISRMPDDKIPPKNKLQVATIEAIELRRKRPVLVSGDNPCGHTE